MKFLIVILLFVSLEAFPQRLAKGQIIDSLSGNPIEYVHIRIGEKGTTTNMAGKYAFRLPEKTGSGHILLSCIGYEKKTIGFNQFKKDPIWKLRPKAYSLPEVVVFDRETEHKEWGFNKERYKEADGRNAPGFIRVVFIANPDNATGIIEKVHYYISDQNDPTQPFRVRLYKPDNSGKPRIDLLKKSVVVQADKGSCFLTVDLTKYNILIPKNGFFVGAEVLSTYNPDEFERYNHGKYYIAFGYTYKWHRKGMGWVYKPKLGWYHFKDRPERNSIGMSSVFYATVKIEKQSFFEKLFE